MPETPMPDGPRCPMTPMPETPMPETPMPEGSNPLGPPGLELSAASGAEPRVIVRRGRIRVAWSRGGRGWSAVR